MATIDLSSEDIEAIAKRTVELLLVEVEHADSTPAGWMDSRMAAEYAATTMQSIHKATAERSIRFAQNGERGRVYFKAEWLDDWREGREPDWGTS